MIEAIAYVVMGIGFWFILVENYGQSSPKACALIAAIWPAALLLVVIDRVLMNRVVNWIRER